MGFFDGQKMRLFGDDWTVIAIAIAIAIVVVFVYILLKVGVVFNREILIN